MKNKQFEEWYIPWLRKQRKDYDKYSDEQLLRKFYRKIWAEQWGVYLEFIATYSIWIELKLLSWNGGWHSNVSGNWVDGDMKMEKAQKNAVEKGMELVGQIIERRKNKESV